MKKIFDRILLIIIAWFMIFLITTILFEAMKCTNYRSVINYNKKTTACYSIYIANNFLSLPAKILGIETVWGNRFQEFSGLRIWGNIIFERLILQQID